MERKLAAIFSADVQGYSRLMGDDEEATVRRLTAYREVMVAFIRQYRGRVVDAPGDNLLADFVSVVDAVQCGVAIQRELKARNSALPASRTMQFRIGINLGDVLVEGERIYGDGVNIAARMEGLAEGGGICLSGTAYDQVENKLHLKYVYLGEQAVKNIARPVRVYRVVMEAEVGEQAQTAQEAVQAQGGRERKAGRGQAPMPVARPGGEQRPWLGFKVAVAVAVVLVVGGIAWQGLQRWGPFRGDQRGALNPHRIAVLPFVNMSGNAEQEYFSDGLTEELISHLAKISGLRVIARTSIMKYKGVSKDVRDIGQELQAGTILEGSVRKGEHTLRITTQLIDVNSQEHLWAEDYDRELKDVLAIQSDIAEKVAKVLKVQLGAGEKQRLEKKGTENLEAYNVYLQGLYNIDKETKDGLEHGTAYLEQAVAKDPTYAQAYAKLAYAQQASAWNGLRSKKDALPQSKATALKALQLDATNAEALAILGNLKVMEWDWSGAQRAFERALALAPNLAFVHHWYAIGYLLPMGRYEDAIAAAQRSIDLDPLSINNQHNLGWVFYLVGRYDQAIAQLQRVLEREPNAIDAYRALGEMYATQGRYEEAIAAMQKLVDLSGGTPYALASLGWAYGVAGQREEARTVLERLQEKAQHMPVDASDFTRMYLGLGDKEQAIAWLQKAYAEGYDAWILTWAKQFPFFDPIRSDPRFIELLRKIGLEK
jgi:TolB-like protein/class 3 adenylate cyclase/Flp pilus assembly protein TadD